MSNEDFSDAFDSTPLSEAVKPVVKPEYTDEQLNDMITYGIDVTYLVGWSKKSEESILTTKGTYRATFFDYILDCCHLKELHQIKLDYATEKQKLALNVAIEEGATIIRIGTAIFGARER